MSKKRRIELSLRKESLSIMKESAKNKKMSKKHLKTQEKQRKKPVVKSEMKSNEQNRKDSLDRGSTEIAIITKVIQEMMMALIRRSSISMSFWAYNNLTEYLFVTKNAEKIRSRIH